MKVLTLGLVLAFGLIAVSATTYCPLGVQYLASQADTLCGKQFALIGLGLNASISSPQLLLGGGFAGVIKAKYATSLNFKTYVCGACMANFTATVDKLYELAATDATCGLLAGGFEATCIYDTPNDMYCGDLNLNTTIACNTAASCCLESFQSFLSSVFSGTTSPNARLVNLVSYDFLCAPKVVTKPDLDTCSFLDGTLVSSDYTWRPSFTCDIDAITDFFDGLKSSSDFSSYSDAEVDDCVDRIKAITSNSATDYYVADSDLVDFSEVCDSCSEIVNAFVDLVESYGDVDTGCYDAAVLFTNGCKHNGDTYCGDFTLGETWPTTCTTTSTAACCAADLVDYYSAVYPTSEATELAEIIDDYVGVCGLTSTQLTAGISSCSTSLTTSLSSGNAAFGFSFRSMFTIVVASIAIAFFMIA